jgi:hypothetical protein
VAARQLPAPNRRGSYPTADPNVIAVSAADAQDELFMASNRGSSIALAAPGIDICIPALAI